MTSRTWVGGTDNNAASSAANWSPNGAPAPGDTLDMLGGTMNIRDDNLAGDTLVIGTRGVNATTTLNLSHHADVAIDIARGSSDQVTVNVAGNDTLAVRTEFPSTGTFAVNLADNARLTGSFSMTFSSVTVSGGDNTRFIHNASSLIEGSSLTFDTAVQGSGSFAVSSAQSRPGTVEFSGSVSRGESVAVTGDPGRVIHSQVLIDEPGAFHGSVALGEFGEVDLKGLLGADSYQLSNDILSIYKGCNVIESLRLTTPPPPPGFGTDYAVTVAQTSTGIVVDRGGSAYGGTLLPVHQGAGTV